MIHVMLSQFTRMVVVVLRLFGLVTQSSHVGEGKNEGKNHAKGVMGKKNEQVLSTIIIFDMLKKYSAHQKKFMQNLKPRQD